LVVGYTPMSDAMKRVLRPSGLETHSGQSNGCSDLGSRVLETAEPVFWQCEAVRYWTHLGSQNLHSHGSTTFKSTTV
jgi:hypothetical protein